MMGVEGSAYRRDEDKSFLARRERERRKCCDFGGAISLVS